MSDDLYTIVTSMDEDEYNRRLQISEEFCQKGLDMVWNEICSIEKKDDVLALIRASLESKITSGEVRIGDCRSVNGHISGEIVDGDSLPDDYENLPDDKLRRICYEMGLICKYKDRAYMIIHGKNEGYIDRFLALFPPKQV